MKEVDYNWLLVGKGTPHRDTHLCQLGRYTGEVETIYIPKTPEMKDDRYVQLYDVSAAANLRTMLMNATNMCWERLLFLIYLRATERYM